MRDCKRSSAVAAAAWSSEAELWRVREAELRFAADNSNSERQEYAEEIVSASLPPLSSTHRPQSRLRNVFESQVLNLSRLTGERESQRLSIAATNSRLQRTGACLLPCCFG